MAEEVVQSLGLGLREIADVGDQLGVAPAHPRAHDLVVAGGIGLVLEHQVGAVGGEQVLVGAAHRHQDILAVLGSAPGAILGGGVGERVGEAVEAVLDGGQEQVALAGEQAEHVRLGDTHASCDPIHRGAVKSADGELVDRGLDQSLAALGGGHTPARGALPSDIDIPANTPRAHTRGALPSDIDIPANTPRAHTRGALPSDIDIPANMPPARAGGALFAGAARAHAASPTSTGCMASAVATSPARGVRNGSSRAVRAPAPSTATPTHMAGIKPSTKACGEE